MQHSNKLAESGEASLETANSTENTEANYKSEQHEKTLESLDLNKKVVVSIQTNEEKQNENNLSN
jgi:hypothetical protein